MKILMGVLISLAGIVLVAVLLIGIFWEQLPLRLVWPYLVQQPIAIQGEVQQVTFTGQEAGEQTYFVFLPENYNAAEQRYRTLYHLHGAYLREPWAGYECRYIGSKMEEAAAAGIIDPMIVICLVDPDGDRMWSDSYDSQFLAATAFIQDLIPHVDATYRTIPERSGRAIQGFSMGGFGAVTNGFLSPDLFSAIIVWDGALHDWQTLSTTRERIADKMFDSADYFDQWSPWRLTESGADADLDMFMVVGEMKATQEFGKRFRPHLESTGREFTYRDVACPHSIFCQMDELGNEGFAFLADSFAKVQAN